MWPETKQELVAIQNRLGRAAFTEWLPAGEYTIGGCFVCFERFKSGTGDKGDPGWAAAVVMRENAVIDYRIVRGQAGGPYQPGLLALREARLLFDAVSGLARTPDVLMVNATGRDHPRRAGMALHIGAVLDIPTIGVTRRPLVALGEQPGMQRGTTAPLRIKDEVVAAWVRTRANAHPVIAHPAWRTSLDTAVNLVLTWSWDSLTPEPLRMARMLARKTRAGIDLNQASYAILNNLD